jgi:hypothetical protein
MLDVAAPTSFLSANTTAPVNGKISAPARHISGNLLPKAAAAAAGASYVAIMGTGSSITELSAMAAGTAVTKDAILFDGTHSLSSSA